MDTVHTYFQTNLEHLHEEEVFDLLTRKGIFTYDYFDSFGTFNEIKLPEKEKYYNTLSNKHLIYEYYEFSKEVLKNSN